MAARHRVFLRIDQPYGEARGTDGGRSAWQATEEKKENIRANSVTSSREILCDLLFKTSRRARTDHYRVMI
jgi:hypothetical protein